MAGASKAQLDFTNVKDGSSFNKKHQPPGDYKGQVTKVQDAKSKSDGTKMWLFTIKAGAGVYPFYCKLQENQLWKVRNLFVAAGINIPKKRVALDPNKIVGKYIGVTLEDDEYDGKMQSNVASTFPTSELEGIEEEDDDDEEEEEDEEETEEEEDEEDDEDSEEEPEESPPVKKKKGKKKAKKVEDVDDEELEELEIEEI